MGSCPDSVHTHYAHCTGKSRTVCVLSTLRLACLFFVFPCFRFMCISELMIVYGLARCARLQSVLLTLSSSARLAYSWFTLY